MTDDERMDRARRIREMREGSRPTDGEPSDDQPADDADQAETDSAPTDDAEPVATGDATLDETDDPAADGEDEAAVTGQDDGDDGAAPETVAADLDTGDADEEGGTIHIPGADVGDVDVDVEAMAEQAGLTSTDDGEAESADGEDSVEPTAPGAVGRAEEVETESAEETRVLEFSLGDEQYCLDIEYVEEIVKRETVTRVPNTPDCVEGVVDLRGQITTILDPKVLLDIPESGSKDLIVVFDPEEFDDQGAVGWVVDDVNQVTPITEDEVNDSPVDQSHVNGVVDRDGEFVIWTTPELDLDEVAG